MDIREKGIISPGHRRFWVRSAFFSDLPGADYACAMTATLKSIAKEGHLPVRENTRGRKEFLVRHADILDLLFYDLDEIDILNIGLHVPESHHVYGARSTDFKELEWAYNSRIIGRRFSQLNKASQIARVIDDTGPVYFATCQELCEVSLKDPLLLKRPESLLGVLVKRGYDQLREEEQKVSIITELREKSKAIRSLAAKVNYRDEKVDRLIARISEYELITDELGTEIEGYKERIKELELELESQPAVESNTSLEPVIDNQQPPQKILLDETPVTPIEQGIQEEVVSEEHNEPEYVIDHSKPSPVLTEEQSIDDVVAKEDAPAVEEQGDTYIDDTASDEQNPWGVDEVSEETLSLTSQPRRTYNPSILYQINPKKVSAIEGTYQKGVLSTRLHDAREKGTIFFVKRYGYTVNQQQLVDLCFEDPSQFYESDFEKMRVRKEPENTKSIDVMHHTLTLNSHSLAGISGTRDPSLILRFLRIAAHREEISENGDDYDVPAKLMIDFYVDDRSRLGNGLLTEINKALKVDLPRSLALHYPAEQIVNGVVYLTVNPYEISQIPGTFDAPLLSRKCQFAHSSGQIARITLQDSHVAYLLHEDQLEEICFMRDAYNREMVSPFVIIPLGGPEYHKDVEKDRFVTTVRAIKDIDPERVYSFTFEDFINIASKKKKTISKKKVSKELEKRVAEGSMRSFLVRSNPTYVGTGKDIKSIYSS